MKTFIISILCLVMMGCATVEIPSYIKADHPYSRKMYGSFETIVHAVRDVLVKDGWKIKTITNPAIYERVEDGDENNNILIFTDVKETSMLVSTTYTHLNVFIHGIAEGAMVEIRYGKITPMFFKKMSGNRHDKLINKMLEQIEQKILETK